MKIFKTTLELWNPESQKVWNLESIGLESGIQTSKSVIHGVESGIHGFLGFPYMRRNGEVLIILVPRYMYHH